MKDKIHQYQSSKYPYFEAEDLFLALLTDAYSHDSFVSWAKINLWVATVDLFKA